MWPDKASQAGPQICKKLLHAVCWTLEEMSGIRDWFDMRVLYGTNANTASDLSSHLALWRILRETKARLRKWNRLTCLL